MLEALVSLLAAVLIALLVFSIAAYLLLRALLIRLGERISADIERPIAASLIPEGIHRVGQGIRVFGRHRGLDDGAAARLYLARIERMARMMDSAVRLPVIGGVGLDALLGLLPMVGDVVSWAVSLRIIRSSLEFGLPRELIAKMIANKLTDLLLGLIPVVGDFADIGYKADLRNVALLKEHLRRRGSAAA